MDTILEISSLHYALRDPWTYQLKTLLKPFSLALTRGEAFGFLGHNGAGKTTTIKCILSLLRPTSGTITINGIDSRMPAARSKVGYLAEQPYFYDHLTVAETLHYFATLAGLTGSERSKAIEQAIQAVKIEERLKSPIRSLSKGLTQRVGLAQAIVAKPQLLILDEPFSGLDPIGRKEFRDLFSELKRSGTTIFMSSHVLPDVEFLCDRVSILSRGELKGVFDLNNLPVQKDSLYEVTFLGTPELVTNFLKGRHAQKIRQERNGITGLFNSQADAQATVKDGLAQGFELIAFSTERGSLEQLFTSLVSFKESSGSHA